MRKPRSQLNVQGMAGLGQGSDTSGSVLLTWHEKVRYILEHRPRANAQLVEVAGVGCIVRVMTDRRTV